ncbi:MAG: ATP-binding cassette domain-containing protein [Nitrososphaerota archaeon]
MNPAIRLKNVSKTFVGGAIALNDISLELDGGRAYGLVGPNGAGKSTLTNIISGYLRPDRGDVFVNGVRIEEYHQAVVEAGVVKVEQHPNLVPALTLLEQLALLYPRLIPDLEEVGRRAKRIAGELEIKLDLDQPAERLPIGQLRIFEIIRALMLCEILREAGRRPVLILDESMAYLPAPQKRRLSEHLKALTERGYTVIMISHDLSDLIEAVDEILVMVKGRIVSRFDSRSAELEDLIRSMFEEVEYFKPSSEIERPMPCIGRSALKLEDLTVVNDRGEIVVEGLELEVFEGEIHGIAAVPGTGEKELAECIYGIRKPARGRVILFGENVTGLCAAELRRRGAGFLSDDRIRDGLILGASIEDNLTIGSEHLFSRGIFLDPDKRRRIAERLAGDFQIILRNLRDQVETLSGGNMQRTYIGRVLGRWDKLLIALHPTVGLDPRGVKLFFDMVLERRRRGLTTIIFSPNLRELLEVCDRVSAFANRRILGTYRPSEITVEKLGMMISGLMEVARA